ncbi:MAG: 12-oxophytodienoate reductase [Planctomycetota bacterium]|nr:12-oxophytodienoate reductase [Planctomycetota bacterium]
MPFKDILAFKPWSLKSMTLRNRIVMAPMTRRKAAEDGIATDEIRQYYERRAQGEVGLIISEGTGIDGVHSFDTATVPRFETPEQHAAWKRVVDSVHEAGGAFAPQLWHCGRLASNPIGPCDDQLSDRPDGTPRPKIRGMNSDDFKQVLNAYISAATASIEMGCDALEIHGAHGYLLDSFLSPSNNTREDEYGGSLENRMRFPLEVVRAVREAVGPDFPVIYRFSQWKVDDYKELKFQNSSELSQWVLALRDAGVDILHVSTRDANDVAFEDEDPKKTLAGWSRDLSLLPVIAVGKVSVTLPMDKAYGEVKDTVADPWPKLKLLEDEEADLIAVGRALIANPNWVQTVRDGHWQDLTSFDKSLLADLH